MKCVYCGSHWGRDENYYLLQTGFSVVGVEDPCFCDSLCKRHFAEKLRRMGPAELSMEGLLEEAGKLFDQDYIELGEDYNQLGIAGNIMEPSSSGSSWLFVGRDGQHFLVDDVYVDIVKREMVLYYRDDIMGTIPKL